jgi:hypothetical protein
MLDEVFEPHRTLIYRGELAAGETRLIVLLCLKVSFNRTIVGYCTLGLCSC